MKQNQFSIDNSSVLRGRVRMISSLVLGRRRAAWINFILMFTQKLIQSKMRYD